MSNANVAASKVRQELLELLLPRLPEGNIDRYKTQEQLDEAMAPLKARFDEIRERYRPGTLLLIDVHGNITKLDSACDLLVTILTVAHIEAFGPTEGCLFHV